MPHTYPATLQAEGVPVEENLIRVFFLIRSLERGGAERQLIELVRALDKTRFNVTVCTFYDGGALRSELEDVGQIAILSLRKHGRWDVLPFILRLITAVRSARPTVVHGYMPVANELGLLAARLSGARFIAGLRASNMDLSEYDMLARLAFAFGAACSRFADAIIVNSQAGRRYHIANGYQSDVMTVIPNGIDAVRFAPDPAARRRVRAAWGIADGQIVIALVGRLDPMKDHRTFLAAMQLVVHEHQQVRTLCVGRGEAPYVAELRRFAAQLPITVDWVDARDDMPAVYNAIDVLVLPSAFGEGFPNVVGEAMATGKPCIVTDVGDAALVVGDEAHVTPPRDPRALAAAIVALVETDPAERAALGATNRMRIVNEFSILRLVTETTRVLTDVGRDGILTPH